MFTVDTRIAALAGGVVLLVAALSLMVNRPPKVPPVATTAAPKAAPATGYAVEKSRKPDPSPPTSVNPEPPSIEEHPTVVESTSAPIVKTLSKNATLQLTTTPGGATFSVYPGVIAGNTAPGATPLRTGSVPNAVENLPPGRYTLFFHHEGWPDDRAEITVNAGENVPVDYTFPHGSATITSVPDGAEIFFGSHSLGQTPLTVDLPLGKQKLVARYPELSDKSQTVTIATSAEAKVTFQMKSQSSHSSRSRATPTPNAMDKIGQSFKHLFGGKTPPARKKK